MSILELEHINKSYGDKILIEDVNLKISKGEKIALIAKNGQGKSSLLKIITGEESADGENAALILDKNTRVAYLPQVPEFNPVDTVLDAALDLDHPAIEAIKAYEHALLAKDDRQLQKTIAIIDDLKAWDIEAKVKEILYLLNLTQLDQKVSELSGGQIKRLALAKILLSDPDFMILDEPTNHLDIEMIEWLERHLQNPSLTILMVTHDRYFLDRVCQQILELDGARLQSYKGSYSDFLEKKALQARQDQTTNQKLLRLFKKELDWMRRQPKARTTKSKSRSDRFGEIKEKTTNIKMQDGLQIQLDGQRLGKKILEFYDVSKSFGSTRILDGFSYKFRKGEKMGIVGPNGAGKTSFIELILGSLKADRGKIVQGETVRFGYYTQIGLNLEQDQRVIEVIRNIADYIQLKNGLKLSAEQLLEQFLFPRYQHRVFASKLSGGEQRRLHLLQVLMSNPNFLILDEPTNDLDIHTLNILEDFLVGFEGCVIAISHDRFFLDKVADHLFIFHGNAEIQDYNGTYSSYRQQKQSRQKEKKPRKDKPAIEEKPAVRKLSYHEKREFNDLENELEKLESEKSKIENIFEKGLSDGPQIEELSIKLGDIIQQIKVKEDRWLELSEYV